MVFFLTTYKKERKTERKKERKKETLCLQFTLCSDECIYSILISNSLSHYTVVRKAVVIYA